ncbi:lipid A-modifier LpxR family protein [Histidinibacterium aquaticum]|uniref:Lipid A deacylase LpxR family protein n=1 Tax=Histidinibacterium aquaticum TaxID=2613962 RepID=A0A5J5GJJ7_9RHOB|nr:lipid A-modifier LpxR family protein [Histidinibacterium aquaticum]KAA9008287.1 lipid A deacylase LpxR family protein [Histidinibacterium aquaticum]
MRAIAAAMLLLLAVGTPAQARETLGFGRLFTNDLIGDGYDRWRSGSYQWSLVRGPGWTGTRPPEAGRVMEYRFRSEIISPTRLNGEGSRSRLYVGLLAAGAHTHATAGAAEISLGADLVFLGPQTGWSALQAEVHERTDAPRVRQEGNEIENRTLPHGTAEVAWPIRSGGVTFRPFVEAQAGTETILRTGADLLWGPVGEGNLLTRDHVTGHLIRAVEGPETGLALVLGGDIARVESSLYLPEDGTADLLPESTRLHGGVHWQVAPDVSFFYGATWLSEEFEGQEEGQVTGSLKLNVSF